MTAIILLHAFPLHRQMWSAQHEALEAAGHQVFSPDFRGYGGNRVPAMPQLQSLDVLADDLSAFLDEHGLNQAVIGGLSLGGYVALAFLRRYPNRVAGLVLADTRATADDDAVKQVRRQFANRVEAEGIGWVAEAMMPGLLNEHHRRDRPDLVALVSGWIAGADPHAVAWTQRSIANRADTMDYLREFRGPALVMVGAQDAMTPPESALAMVAALHEARYREIEDSAHLSAIEAPQAVSDAIIQWLQ